MSLQSSRPDESGSAVRLRAGHFTFTVRSMIAPLLLLITDERRSRKAAENRRRTQREIAALPASVQEDIAFLKSLKHNDI